MRGRHGKRHANAVAESAHYFVTLVMEPLYNFIHASTLVECPLLYKDGDIQLKRPSNPMEGVEVGYDAFTNQAYPEISALITIHSRRCPFSIVALCSDDPVALPVAFDIYVDVDLFERLKARDAYKDMAGEGLVTAMLMRAYQEHQLLFRTTMEGCTARTAKRQRLRSADSVESAESLDFVDSRAPQPLEVVMAYEEAHVSTTLQHFADFLLVHDNKPREPSYAFCFRSQAFVSRRELRPKLYDQFDVLPNMRFVVGARNTGKTRYMCSFIQHALPGSEDQCPSYMLPVHATLLVVPASLVSQWHAALAHQTGLRVHLATNKRTYQQLTLEKLLNSDAIITTHAFFAAQTQTVKRTVSSSDRAKLKRKVHDVGDRAKTRVQFQAVWWQRIVIDEVQQFYVEHSTKWFVTATTTLTKMWWCLQGGVERTSHKLYFAGEMLQHGLNYVSLPPIDSPIIIELPPDDVTVPCPAHHTITTPLNATEADVYSLMQQTSAVSHWLKLVCSGDTSWVKQYMQPVQFWLDAASQGVESLKASMMTSSQMRVSRVGGDEDEDEEGSESAYGSESSDVIVMYDEEDGRDAMDATYMNENPESDVVHEPMDDEPNPANDEWDQDDAAAVAEDDAEDDAPVALQSDVAGTGTMFDTITRTITTTLSTAIQRQNARIMERQAFFMRTVMALVNGTEQVQQCSICLCGDADCIFVCGHTMCHECVVQVFEREHSGDFTSCPTCRWEIEASDVFWVTPAPHQSSKANALIAVLRMVMPHSHVLVVALEPTITKTMHQHLIRAGISRIKQHPVPSAYTNTVPVHPHVHFVAFDDLPGLKLPFISHVVLLSPLAPDKVTAANALSTVLSVMNPKTEAHVYQLIAADTVEAACIQ